MKEKEAAHYLAGLIDGEGSVGLNGQVRITNYDEDLIDAGARCCQVLGLRYTKDARWRGFSYVDGRFTANTSGEQARTRLEHSLRIRVGSLPILARDVPLQSAKKREALRQFLGRRGIGGQMSLL